MMSVCRVVSCVVERGYLLWPVYSLGKENVSLCPASSCTPRPNLLVTPGISSVPTFAFQSPRIKRTSLSVCLCVCVYVLILESLVALHRTIQFSSVAQSCLTLCDPMNHSMPGLPVHHQLPEFTQTHVHWVRDAIQSSHPRSSPSPPAPNPSQHQSLFQWVNSSHEVSEVLEPQL